MGSVEFAANYKRLHDAYEGRDPTDFEMGSFGALVYQYKRSGEFDKLGDRTKQEYRRHLDAMGERWRDLPVNLLERDHVSKFRDEFLDRPAVGNNRSLAR